MSAEKDEATMAEEQAHLEAGHVDGGVEEVEGVPPQILATPGMPERKAVDRRQARVRENLHLLPKGAQEAILESFEVDKAEAAKNQNYDAHARHRDEADTEPTLTGETVEISANPWPGPTMGANSNPRHAAPGLISLSTQRTRRGTT